LKIPSDKFDLDFGDEEPLTSTTTTATVTTTTINLNEDSDDAVSDEEVEADDFLPTFASFSQVTFCFHRYA
jgi:hypothetical protein